MNTRNGDECHNYWVNSPLPGDRGRPWTHIHVTSMVQGYLQAPTIEELIHEIEISRSPVIFIPYTPAWFDINNPDDITRFITVCRDRARKKGPVVLLALHTTDIIPSLKDGADHGASLSPVRMRGRALVLKEQIRLDQIDVSFSSPVMGKKLCGQMKLATNIKMYS